MTGTRPAADSGGPQNTAGTAVTAEAVIQTPDPARYIARLCRHATQMSAHATQVSQHLRHRDTGDAGPPQVQHAEWTATAGTVTLNWGQWTLHAGPGTLTIRAEAGSTASLRRIQDLLTTRLEKLGKRERLTLTWQPPRTAPAGPDNGHAPRTQPPDTSTGQPP